ncbi:hypothetical protein [Streptomyces sp. NPDC048269]|uniref:hypothetical protein n=1 Tax=Streptomyces sp. NPDC048269 TaxID=3155753 RepID=UPI00341E7D90
MQLREAFAKLIVKHGTVPVVVGRPQPATFHVADAARARPHTPRSIELTDERSRSWR